MGKNFSNLKVILVEPSGPLNVGSVARLCSNFEVDELRIVSPKCDVFSLEAKKMIEPLLCGIVLGLVPITLLGLFVSAWNQYRRGSGMLDID